MKKIIMITPLALLLVGCNQFFTTEWPSLFDGFQQPDSHLSAGVTPSMGVKEGEAPQQGNPIPMPETDVPIKPIDDAALSQLRLELQKIQSTLGAQKMIFENSLEDLMLVAAEPNKARTKWMNAQLELSRLDQVRDQLTNFISSLKTRGVDPKARVSMRAEQDRTKLQTYIMQKAADLDALAPEDIQE